MPEQGRPVFALEVSPLGERHYTGIANVTRMLAKEMLDDPEIEAKFVMGRSEIPPALIEKLLGLGGGDILWWLAGRLDSRPRFAGDFDRPIVGLYPSTKPYRRLFPFEALILHDLTTVVTPQFHTEEAVGFWQQHLLPDMLSSELLIAGVAVHRQRHPHLFPAGESYSLPRGARGLLRRRGPAAAQGDEGRRLCAGAGNAGAAQERRDRVRDADASSGPARHHQVRLRRTLGLGGGDRQPDRGPSISKRISHPRRSSSPASSPTVPGISCWRTRPR